MTFDTEQVKVIREIARGVALDEISKQLKDIPTKAEFNRFAKQMSLQNKTLNDSVQQLLGKQETWLMVLNAKDETVRDLKTKVETLDDYYEDLDNRMARFGAIVIGDALTGGKSVVTTTETNHERITNLEKYVELKMKQEADALALRKKELAVAFKLFESISVRWIAAALIGAGIGGRIGLELLNQLLSK
ncbi:hypothetical protein KC887_02460 [Candidatus Kaiserbacteria bacterium]|nr:hypothetical protein [Candidatus Kaiserbacteria bacterium]